MFTPVVAACCIRDGFVLLQSRKLDRRNQEFLNFPGGKVEEDETLEEALSREIREELGATVERSKLVHSQVNVYQGYQEHYLILFYEVTLSGVAGPVDLLGNHLYWISIDTIPLRVLPGTLETLRVISREVVKF